MCFLIFPGTKVFSLWNSWCFLTYHAFLGSILYSLILYLVPWYSVSRYGTFWYFLVFPWVLGYFLLFSANSWYSMLFFDILGSFLVSLEVFGNSLFPPGILENFLVFLVFLFPGYVSHLYSYISVWCFHGSGILTLYYKQWTMRTYLFILP